ncbi:MAG: Thioredoxin [candidate division BRC1 bacterium ADurb.BinA364]|nr:MAG: Thioredoxin [candidate division BRC1 bacterium ADurb.BinA364]
MKRHSISTAALLLFFSSMALGSSTTPTLTIEQAYPSLPSGALAQATLADLEEGVILRADSLTISLADLEAELAQLPAEIQDEMNRNRFFMLEQIAAKQLLLHLAKASSAEAQGEAMDEEGLIQAYLEKTVADVQASEAETAKFYEENKELCGGASLDQIQNDLMQFLTRQKRDEAAAEHIRTLARRVPIAVSAPWTKAQAALAMENPVDRARASGIPSLIDFGSTGCTPCDMMAPILDEMKIDYADRMNVEFIHVGEKRILAARYGIQSIPVQILFDKDGKEVWRHTGYIPRDQIEEQIAIAIGSI